MRFQARLFAVALTLVGAALLFSPPAAAAKRAALVIGNSAYLHVPHLANPTNDARDVAEALQALGFDVILGTDVDKSTFDKDLSQFSQALAGADVGLLFFAGHGLQAKGVNHLIPIDATIANEYSLALETVTLDSVLKQMEQAKTKILVLDACRNNPFAKSLATSMGTSAVREDLGLAISVPSGVGTFIAYSTQPGNVALDGAGRNSPFTGPFKMHISQPGASLSDIMIAVRDEVVKSTDGAQVPWDDSALMSTFYFREGPAGASAPQLATDSNAGEAAEAWSWIKNTTDLSILQEFLRRYKDTPFAQAAQGRLNSLQSQAATPAQVIPNIGTVSLVATKPSYDCKVHYEDAEVTICNNPELAILDNELDRVYKRVAQRTNATEKQALVLEQRRWLEARNACTTNARCLAAQYRKRIASFGTASLRDAKLTAGRFRPSFDCNTNFLPAEGAVCSSAELAELDVRLDRAYAQRVRDLAPARKKALAMEQRHWLRHRDTCGTDAACVRLQYQVRLGQLQARDRP